MILIPPNSGELKSRYNHMAYRARRDGAPCYYAE